ncbi:MAG: hypothetical protein ACOX6Q_00105 [Candidatus Dojkabacteria bacterium]|jgi:hypothetical protein
MFSKKEKIRSGKELFLTLQNIVNGVKGLEKECIEMFNGVSNTMLPVTQEDEAEIKILIEKLEKMVRNILTTCQTLAVCNSGGENNEEANIERLNKILEHLKSSEKLLEEIRLGRPLKQKQEVSEKFYEAYKIINKVTLMLIELFSRFYGIERSSDED